MSNKTDPSLVHDVADCLQDIAGPEEKGVPGIIAPPQFFVETFKYRLFLSALPYL